MSRRFDINARNNNNQRYHNRYINSTHVDDDTDIEEKNASSDEEELENENKNEIGKENNNQNLVENKNITNVSGKLKIKLPSTTKIRITLIAVTIFFIVIFIYMGLQLVTNPSLLGNDNKSAGLGGRSYYDGACSNVIVDGELKDIETYVTRLTITQLNNEKISTNNLSEIKEDIISMSVDTRTKIIAVGEKGDKTDSENGCAYNISSDSLGIKETENETLEKEISEIIREAKGAIIVNSNGQINEIENSEITITDGKVANENSDNNSQENTDVNANNMSLTYKNTSNNEKNNIVRRIKEELNLFEDEYLYLEFNSKNKSDNGVQKISKNTLNNLSGSLGDYLKSKFSRAGKKTDISEAVDIYGISIPGAMYLDVAEDYDWESIIKYYHDDDIEIMTIYKGLSYSGDYPINPDDELYQGLTFFTDSISFDDFLAQKGSSAEEFGNNLKSAIENAGAGTREGTVTAAMTLIGSLAEMGIKFNYQWGGKFHNVGIRPEWGLEADPAWMEKICSSYVRLYGNHDHCVYDYRWNSFDCSGFVNWAITNGLQRKVDNIATGSGGEALDPYYAVCRPGGVLVGSGHIVLVVATDDETQRYIVAESTGSDFMTGSGGVKLSYYWYGTKGYECNNLTNLYGD